MIRFLQQDNRIVKGLLIGFICIALISLVAYLIPGNGDTSGANDPAVYAMVRDPGLLGRVFGDTTPIKTTEVAQLAQRQLQQQRLPDFLLSYMMTSAGKILVQRTILKHEADRMHLQVSDEDLRRELRTGAFAQYLFPNGVYIGDDAYMNFVQQFNMSRSDFESQVKQDMELNRLQALITGGVTVPDNQVREAYRVQGTKVKFDYAVISSDDLRKTINPTEGELETFFKQSPTRYATAIPETRKIEYASFDASKLPGGKPQVTDAEVAAYYAAHKEQYKVEEQVKTRHILFMAPAGDAKADGAAKAKAGDVLKQVKAGGDFAELAKKYSEDTGSKAQGGELPMIPTSGLDAAYAKAAMALKPGETSEPVRSKFGYHIIQTEAKQAAGVKPLAEVKDSIVPVVEQQAQGSAEQAFAEQLVAEAKKSGLEKAAAAHGMRAVTTEYVAKDGVIGGVSDASSLLTMAFTAAKGAAPGLASTGDGYAVFQVLDVKTAHAPAFADWKTHVLEDYREQKTPQLLSTQLNKLEDRAKVLNDLKKAAAEMGVALKTSELVGQEGQVPDLGAMSGPGSVAFTLAKGAVSGPINTGRAGVVLSVTDKQEPTPEEMAKNFAAMRDQLLNQEHEEIFRVYIGTLSDKYEKAGAIKYAKTPPATPGLPAGM